jgi:hypothetical protein
LITVVELAKADQAKTQQIQYINDSTAANNHERSHVNEVQETNDDRPANLQREIDDEPAPLSENVGNDATGEGLQVYEAVTEIQRPRTTANSIAGEV